MATTQRRLSVGDEICFCPDSDRGARFKIIKEEPAVESTQVHITIQYQDGRWAPGDGNTDFPLNVPRDYTKDDIECAWFEIPNFERYTT